MNEEPLLIHSLAEFAGITLPVLEAADARSVCEIGAEHGGNSTVLGDWLAGRGGTLVSIDPAPGRAFLDWLAGQGERVRHLPATSLAAIEAAGAHDAWFIDGDHNWYTVFNELSLIHRVQRAAGRPLLVMLHDIDWPWARRDMYYAPERIPPEFLLPHSFELGVTRGSRTAISGGFRGCGAFAVALEEGGPRNGVLTAVEDFVAGLDEPLLWAHVPGVFGLGVLFDRDHPAAGAIAQLLAPLHEHPLLARLEANRLANYLRVIEWQDRQATAATPSSSSPDGRVRAATTRVSRPAATDA
ncbi:MAG: class I SAM-dependent methyltransferase [Limnobacter sp.]|nr:class I SAM-dependent methyltransferase [Limnobacter sp.]